MRFLCALAVCSLTAFAASAIDDTKPDETKKDGAVVREIELKDLKAVEKQGSKWVEPTVIKSEEDLKKVFGDSAKAIKVDFKKEYLALFRWAGSGGDKLTHTAETADGKTVVTSTLKPGLTKDLRQHVKLIALPAKAEWKAGGK